MAETTPDISVVVPHFNAPALLRRALESAAAQTLSPLEVIVVDDASCRQSADEAHRVVEQFSPLARLVELPYNAGPGAARNAGWELARGKWIAFLDADDTWDDDKLKIQAAALRVRPDVVLCSHQVRLRGSATGPATSDVESSQLTYRSLLWRNRVATSTVMVRRNVRERFPTFTRHSEDYALWLDVASMGPILHLEVPLTVREARQEGLSAQTWRMQRGEMQVLRTQATAGRIPRSSLPLRLAWSSAKFGVRLMGRAR